MSCSVVFYSMFKLQLCLQTHCILFSFSFLIFCPQCLHEEFNSTVRGCLCCIAQCLNILHSYPLPLCMIERYKIIVAFFIQYSRFHSKELFNFLFRLMEEQNLSIRRSPDLMLNWPNTKTRWRKWERVEQRQVFKIWLSSAYYYKLA